MLWSVRVRVQISPDGYLGYLKIPAISSVGKLARLDDVIHLPDAHSEPERGSLLCICGG